MSKVVKTYKDIISPEIIQLYAECVGVQDKLSYEVTKLEKEIEELHRQKDEQWKKYTELCDNAEFIEAEILTSRKKTRPASIFLCLTFASFISVGLTLTTSALGMEFMGILIGLFPVSLSTLIISFLGMCITVNDKFSFLYGMILYKLDKKYKKSKDIYDSYNKQKVQERQISRDWDDTVSAKEKELEEKRKELQKAEEACEIMEKKFDRITILEAAVALGANPEILKVAQNIREHMVPNESSISQQSLEENGKGQFTLTAN